MDVNLFGLSMYSPYQLGMCRLLLFSMGIGAHLCEYLCVDGVFVVLISMGKINQHR